MTRFESADELLKMNNQERETIRCGKCGLNQFVTVSGQCRRCRTVFVVEAVKIKAPAAPQRTPNYAVMTGRKQEWANSLEQRQAEMRQRNMAPEAQA